MAGKATFLVIIGFTLVFMVAIKNFGRISTDSVGNMVTYYTEMIAHNIAVSGANLASNQIFVDPTWDDGYSDEPLSGGTFDVTIQIIDAYKNIRQITSTGSYHGLTSTVKVTLSPSKFSKFAYYSVSEGGTIWWTGSDTVWGPFHTQDYLRAAYHPVFFGKASSLKSLVYKTNKTTDKPNFLGGYETGISLPMPTDAVDNMEAAADAGGLEFNGHDTVYICFANDSLKYKYSYGASYSSLYLPDAASNGMIFAKNAVVRLQGTVKGQYTIGCNSTTSSTGKGTIYLDDDIIYDKDPRQYPNSTDMLGICAENSVLITDNKVNKYSIDIHASVYSEKGGFGADNYDTRPISGNINLLGGIIQNTRKAVGTFSGTTINHGFAKRYKYDDRFMLASPPYFPGTGGFEIVSWFE
ncbi:MAG: hypothetical protein IPI19_16995 [Ignavibacteriales bacterium]|nr:hypothetical protein [Ignavibacteriales bacterium]MBP9881721.1 hypothetical protein [Chitinophagales bacterium]